MANEVTVPLLPCASIDDIIDFYAVLGFRTTYKQRKPHPYVALQREDLNLHFFEMAGFDPDDSYGSCLVLTDDIAGLHGAFAAGMRAAYGKVLVSGRPRMTRPRARKNYDGLGGFSVVDPGGNWIRVVDRSGSATAAAPVGRLAKTLANAVVLADSKGDAQQAAKILDSALARTDPDDDPVDRLEVLVYRAELALVLNDPATAADLLNTATAVELSAPDAARAAPTLSHAADLHTSLPTPA